MTNDMGRNLPHDPAGQPLGRIPQRGEVPEHPAIFDSRTQAWRIHNTSHVLRRDPLHDPNVWPRQQAAVSCNELELFERLEVLITYYQLEFHQPNLNKANLLVLPYQFIKPEAGWKLKNTVTLEEYVIKSALTSRGPDGEAVWKQEMVNALQGYYYGHWIAGNTGAERSTKVPGWGDKW